MEKLGSQSSIPVRPRPRERRSRLTAIAARVAPNVVASFAARRFLTPSPVRVEATEHEIVACARRDEISFRGRRVVTYRWGSGASRTALLVHGWSGAAGDLTAFVDPLRAAGYDVVAFDAPAHGASGGTTTNVSAMAHALAAVARAAGGCDFVVAHSLGATAAAHAIARGLDVARLALIAPVPGVRVFAHAFARGAGFDEGARRAFEAAIEVRVGARLVDLEIEAVRSCLSCPALVVYDEDDRLAPPPVAMRVIGALRAPEVIATRGLGHRRILRAPAVVDAVERFADPTRDATARGAAISARAASR